MMNDNKRFRKSRPFSVKCGWGNHWCVCNYTPPMRNDGAVVNKNITTWEEGTLENNSSIGDHDSPWTYLKTNQSKGQCLYRSSNIGDEYLIAGERHVVSLLDRPAGTWQVTEAQGSHAVTVDAAHLHLHHLILQLLHHQNDLFPGRKAGPELRCHGVKEALGHNDESWWPEGSWKPATCLLRTCCRYGHPPRVHHVTCKAHAGSTEILNGKHGLLAIQSFKLAMLIAHLQLLISCLVVEPHLQIF